MRGTGLAIPALAGLLYLLAGLFVPVAAGGAPDESVRQAVAATCATPSADPAAMAERIPDAAAAGEEPLIMRGTDVGWTRRFMLPDGAEIRVERFAPADQLRRLTVEYHEADPGGGTRPRLALVADAGCTIRLGRRLVYAADSPHAVAVEHLDGDLEATGEREPLNPPVPDGTDPGGIAVALVDSGVNYLLPEVGNRLARDTTGAILGHDYWNLDDRPFDAHPARSPFFPQRHGTRTATLLLREAPAIRLVPYRYPRPDMGRMTDLVAAAAASGIVIVNIAMGSTDRDDWEAFATAAAAHPDMLFVLSAGNEGRDLDTNPSYPAALGLDNALVVTSSRGSGEIAPGSNWGRESVDLLVPAERMVVTGFDGSEVGASGSSYAAVRISALAARLLAEHPDWRAPELKAAISARVLPAFAGDSDRVAGGFMPRPDKAERLPPLSVDGPPRQIARHAITLDSPDTEPLATDGADFILQPTFAYVEDTAWNADRLQRHGREMAAILAQCGISVPRIDVRVLGGPPVYRYFHDTIGTELVRYLELPKPTAYFVDDTLQVEPYDAEAIGRANSRTRPRLRDTIWLTAAARDPGIALAHEFVHVLMDSGDHVETPGNLMQARTAPDDTDLTDDQCDAIVTTGTDNGLLIPATR